MAVGRHYAERAWWAYQSLDERQADGDPISRTQLEIRTHERDMPWKLNQSELAKFLQGKYDNPSYRVVMAVATVLGVDSEWLMRGIGTGPKRSLNLGEMPAWPHANKAKKLREAKRPKEDPPAGRGKRESETPAPRTHVRPRRAAT